MRPSDLDTVRSLSLFSQMPDAHFAVLTEAALLQRFPPSVVLIDEGALPDFLHVVVEGQVELFSQHSERETTIDIIQPVSTFILAAVIRDEPYLNSARTIAESRILMIPAGAVRQLFSQNATFARAVVSELAQRYRGIVRTLKNERLRTSVERLANWILRADREQGGTGQVSFPFDKRTLASQLGMTPENLSRNLAQLTRHGIASSGRLIEIADRAALIAIARPNDLID